MFIHQDSMTDMFEIRDNFVQKHFERTTLSRARDLAFEVHFSVAAAAWPVACLLYMSREHSTCNLVQIACQSTVYVATWCPTRMPLSFWIDSRSTRTWINLCLITTSTLLTIPTWAEDSSAASRRSKCIAKCYLQAAGKTAFCNHCWTLFIGMQMKSPTKLIFRWTP